MLPMLLYSPLIHELDHLRLVHREHSDSLTDENLVKWVTARSLTSILAWNPFFESCLSSRFLSTIPTLEQTMSS